LLINDESLIFHEMTFCLHYYVAEVTKMPFMKGVAPIRRTTKYLASCPLVFKPRVKIMTINFNEEETERHHSGARDFVFWNLPQVQYRNPHLQIVTFRNLTPSPFITCFLEDSTKVYFDVDSQSNKEIMDRLVRTLGKSAEVTTVSYTCSGTVYHYLWLALLSQKIFC
jgi:hypothetical protein